MLCYPRRAARHAHAMRARCLPDSAAAAAAYAELGWRAFSLLAGLQQISRTCCERYRTTLQHFPSRKPSSSPASVVRPVFALASCESAYVVRREALLPVQAHPSFCQPVVLETYSHGYDYPHAPTLHSRLLRLLIDGMQLAL